MSDTITETSTSGYGNRLKNSITRALLGFLFICGSVWLLWWNEYNSIKRTETLNEGEREAVSGQVKPIDTRLEGKLIHVIGDTETKEILKDNILRITTDALKLQRKVEMYQWKENKETKTKDKLWWWEETVTTYNYTKERSEKSIDSDVFHKKEGHENPKKWWFKSQEFVQKKIHIWDFILSDVFVRQLNNWENLPIDVGNMAKRARKNVHINSQEIYLGQDPSSHQIGDVRITFAIVPKGTISIVGKQTSNEITTYRTKNNGSINLLEQGSVDVSEMFARAHDENVALTRWVRVAGLLLMFGWFYMIFGVIVAIAKILPFLGNVLDVWVILISLICTIVLGIGTIAVSWIVVRPIIWISLLVLIIVLVWFIKIKHKNKKTETQFQWPIEEVNK